ncbi:hypothetical protein BDY19DRAFT_417605 [Irpex rosettiformis]|uniref:Uncharacterized protein n=1 Tax=Irpex rosettiformis TaxID=378272 RepID=A0ACB8UG54_9APHY|nr:hypothetical protein BDY19DRAFT_417605 [Irpex rosettiformis]
MIILDEEDGQYPKLDPPLPLHVRTNRSSSPNPSLPDYETSQEQIKFNSPRKRHLPKKLKWALWGLGMYFVITVAIGVPLIVLKSRSEEDDYRAPSLNSWYGINGSIPVLPPIFNLATLPVCLDDASKCSDWTDKDVFDGTSYSSHLEYYLPVAPTLFVQSNMTLIKNTTLRHIGGSLNVGVNKNPNETDVKFTVDMLYSSPDIRERTSVCMIKLNISDSNGLYVYVPSGLKGHDQLSVNISLELPRHDHNGLYVSNFITALPYFSQYLSTGNSNVTFGNIALGGYKENLHIDTVNAEAVLVRSTFGGLTGVYSVNPLDDGDGDPS